MKRSHPLWLVLLLGLCVPAPSRAQNATSDVQGEIERTEQRIDRARTVVNGSGSVAAQAEVDHAVELQAGARSALLQGKPRVGLGMTLRGRSAADRAIAIVNGLPDPERVTTQLDRTRDLLERSRGQIEACDQARAHTLLRTAGDMQRHAEDAGHGGHYLAALQLTMGARERVDRALRQCNVVTDAHEGVDRALRRTDQVIQNARERLGARPPGQARALLARASELQVQARQEYGDRHFDPCIQHTLSARAMAFRAARIADRAR